MDYPRFEPVRGEPDGMHRHYHGGRLVDLVLRLVDWWRCERGKLGGGTTRAGGIGPIEIHERPAPVMPSGGRRDASKRTDPMENLDRILLEAYMSRDHLITSARTRTLQAGVLAALVLFLTAILVQSVAEHQRGRGTLASSTAAPPAAGSMESAPRQSAGLLAGSEAYRAEKCAGDYVCDEDGAWDTVYPTRSPMVRAEAERRSNKARAKSDPRGG